MKRSDFTATPEEIIGDAITYGLHLKKAGYPRTPIFSARRGQETILFEIMTKIDFKKIEKWVLYAKCCESDTRIQIGVPDGCALSQAQIEKLKERKIGIFIISNGEPLELVVPVDLSLHIELPELSSKLRPLFGGAYGKIKGGDLLDGFFAACIEFEKLAKKYLIRQMKSRNIKVMKSKNTLHTARTIAQLPMGGLAIAFSNIDNPIGRDNTILRTLEFINEDRITAAHDRTDPKRLKHLRNNCAKNMLLIVDASQECLK